MIILPILIALFFPHQEPQNVWNKYQINGFTQGTTYNISYYAKERSVGEHQVDSIFASIDQSLSIYKENSLISQFNNSSKGILADKHLIKVVKRSKEINKATNGLFDITLLPLMNAWGFHKKGMEPTTPDAAILKDVKTCMGNTLLERKGNQLFKKKACVQIDVNGIAQGYTVDVVADFLLAHKITNFLVEIGGEIRVSGRRQPSGEMMKVGIQSPSKQEGTPVAIQKIVQIASGAITTSGNYQKFYESNGKKISHLMNPKTGLPVDNDLISVTVYAKDAITADGYDNALMAMGLKEAFKFLKKNNQLEAYFIYKDKMGVVKDTATTKFYSLMQ